MPDPSPCPRWTTGHARYCELADPGHAAYYPAIVPSLIRRASSGAPGAAYPPPPRPGSVLDRIRRLAVCPERSGERCPLPGFAPGCGCSVVAYCAAGLGSYGGGATASRDDCVLRCVRNFGAEAGPAGGGGET